MSENKSKPTAKTPAQSDDKTNEVLQEENWQDIECYIQSYSAIAEWIRFADAKAAVILTVSGAAAGFLIPTVKDILANHATDHLFPFWRAIVLSFFAIYMFFFLFSNVVAFLCINPFRRKGKHPSMEHCQHFHPAAISANFSSDSHQQFAEEVTAGGAKLLRKEIQVAILLDSHISDYKYGKIKLSLKLFCASVFFAFAYFLASQL